MLDTIINSGLGNVPSYQLSSLPFLTSSIVVPATGGTPVEVEFPFVSRFIVVRNTEAVADPSVPIQVGFSVNGTTGSVQNNYFTLDNGESFEAEFRVKSLFAVSSNSSAGTMEVIAGLTDIKKSQLEDNWSGSLGIG